MAEQIDLTTPVTRANLTLYKIRAVRLDLDAETIEVRLHGDDGTVRTVNWDGSEAVTLILALNKADLSTNSLNKRIMTKIINDGLLTGSVSGTPD